MYGTPKYRLGEVVVGSDAGYVGTRHFFSDIGAKFPSTSVLQAGSAWCEAVFVKNLSGGTLAKGLRVLPSTTAATPGLRGCLGAAGADVAFVGFVNPFLETATVAINAGFWLITKGFTRVGYDGSATIAVGDTLSGAASGWVSESGETYEDPWCIGFACEVKTSGSAGDLIDAYVTCPFV
jgi:hypothetical protein